MRQHSNRNGIVRRVMALVLCLVMTFSLSVMSFAEDTSDSAMGVQEGLGAVCGVVAELSGEIVDIYKQVLPEIGSVSVDDLMSDPSVINLPALNGGLRLDLFASGAEFLTQMAGMDFSWFNSAEVDFTLGGKSVNLFALLNDNEILKGYLTYDAESETLYVQIPDLSASYIKLAVGPYLEQMTMGLQSTLGQVQAIAPAIAEALPEGAVVTSILNRYFGIIVSHINNVSSEAVTIEPSYLEMTMDATEMTITITEAELAEIVVDVLETAKTDEELKGVLEGFLAAGPALAEAGLPGLEEADPEAVWSNLVTQMEEYQADIQQYTTEGGMATDYNYMQLKLDVDANGMPVGCSFHFSDSEAGPVEMAHAYFLPTPEATGIEFVVSVDGQDICFVGSGAAGENGYNGSYDVRFMGMKMVTFDVMDAKVDETGATGSLMIRPASGLAMLMNNAGGDASIASLIMSFGLKLDWDITGAMNVCKLSITDADAEPLATLSLGIAPGGEVVEIMPAEGDTVYDIENSDDGNLYGSEIDVQALIEKIEAAGVPEEIIQSVMGY